MKEEKIQQGEKETRKENEVRKSKKGEEVELQKEKKCRTNEAKLGQRTGDTLRKETENDVK